MVFNCKTFYLVKTGGECGTIASTFGISLADFYSWNPAIGTCKALWADTYVSVGPLTSTPSPTTTKPTASATTGNGIATPSPTLPGMVTNCDVFEYVDAGEDCDGISRARGLSLADFVKFNPAVKADCSGIWADYYVCVSIIGHTLSTLTTSTKPTTTKSGNGVTTPTPTQTRMVTNCKTFEYVDEGETCESIAKARGVMQAQFIAWNPAVGADCKLMRLNSYVCVGLI